MGWAKPNLLHVLNSFIKVLDRLGRVRVQGSGEDLDYKGQSEAFVAN